MFRSHEEVYRTPCTSKTQSEIFNCDLCDEGGWHSETDMQIHRKDGHSQELWHTYYHTNTSICLSCSKTEKNQKALVKHIKSDHLLSSEDAYRVEREIFICDYCSHMFFNKATLQCHMVKHLRHQGKKTKTGRCPKCNKVIKLSTIWSHLEHHRLQSVSVCPICLEKCTNTKDLREHLLKHPKYYHCNICNYTATKDKYFLEHIRRHKEMKVVPCVDVDLSRFFMPSTRMMKSTNFVQYAIKGLMLFNNVNICVLCREICTSAEQMKRHILRDHFTEKKVETKQSYVCYCGEQFFNNVLLKQHMFKAHDSSKKVDTDTPENEVTAIIDRIFDGNDDHEDDITEQVDINEIIVRDNITEETDIGEVADDDDGEDIDYHIPVILETGEDGAIVIELA